MSVYKGDGDMYVVWQDDCVRDDTHFYYQSMLVVIIASETALLVRSMRPCRYIISYVRPFGPAGGAKYKITFTHNAQT